MSPQIEDLDRDGLAHRAATTSENPDPWATFSGRERATVRRRRGRRGVSKGAVRAELVRDGSATPLTPDSTGYATVRVPLDEKASVRAFDEDGDELGSTPLALPVQDPGGLPGEHPATRLAD